MNEKLGGNRREFLKDLAKVGSVGLAGGLVGATLQRKIDAQKPAGETQGDGWTEETFAIEPERDKTGEHVYVASEVRQGLESAKHAISFDPKTGVLTCKEGIVFDGETVNGVRELRRRVEGEEVTVSGPIDGTYLVIAYTNLETKSSDRFYIRTTLFGPRAAINSVTVGSYEPTR